MNKIICFFGTRPEYIKVKPILDKAKNYSSCYVRQHKDTIKDINSDFVIDIDDGPDFRLNNIFSQILNRSSGIICNFDGILVQGDTATSAAVALAAFNLKKQVIHLEAGLRTYNLSHPFPEEGYRQIISRIATIHFCPTDLSRSNLIKECITDNLYVVGNSGLDNLVDKKNFVSDDNTVLITLHRTENISIMDQWFNQIDSIAEKDGRKFILIKHPNPKLTNLYSSLRNVYVINPLPHEDLINILTKSSIIITDSGGIQEECSFFGKKVIVCRETTERPEGIESGHIRLCKKPEDLSSLFYSFLSDNTPMEKCPYGNGTTAEQVVSILQSIK